MMLWNISGRGEARKRADPSEAAARADGYEKAKERWEQAKEEQIASQLNDDLERVESDKSDKDGEAAKGSGETVPFSVKYEGCLLYTSPSPRDS